jgi:hypothetical protein
MPLPDTSEPFRLSHMDMPCYGLIYYNFHYCIGDTPPNLTLLRKRFLILFSARILRFWDNMSAFLVLDVRCVRCRYHGSHMYCSARSSHTISPFPCLGFLGVLMRFAKCRFSSKSHVKLVSLHLLHHWAIPHCSCYEPGRCRTEFSVPSCEAGSSGGPI